MVKRVERGDSGRGLRGGIMKLRRGKRTVEMVEVGKGLSITSRTEFLGQI